MQYVACNVFNVGLSENAIEHCYLVLFIFVNERLSATKHLIRTFDASSAIIFLKLFTPC